MQLSQTPLELAIAAYHANEHHNEEDRPSIRQIAKDFTVSSTTLSNRLSGQTESRSKAHSHQQALSNDEEASLVDYIRRSSLLGHPPPPYMVYQTAEAIRQNRVPIDPTTPSPPLPSLGHTWLDKFRKRHPEVTSDPLATRGGGGSAGLALGNLQHRMVKLHPRIRLARARI